MDEIHEIAELVFHIYATDPGVENTVDATFPAHVAVIAVRVADHDELVIAEPGPFKAPAPDSAKFLSWIRSKRRRSLRPLS